MTPLHHVVAYGSYQFTMIEMLLEYYADVNAVTQKGQTALHIAVLRQKSSWRTVVRMLLQRGADPNIIDAEGRTVFDCSPNPEEVHQLLAYQVA